MTAVEEAVAPEQDATAVDEARPETAAPVEHVVSADTAPTPVEVANADDTFTFDPIKPETDEFGEEIVYDSPTITVQSAGSLIKPDKQRWFWWKITQLQKGDPMGAPQFWLDFAKVDQTLQSRILNLTTDEWDRFFTEWLRRSTGATPGE
jgi:hypothetical protein